MDTVSAADTTGHGLQHRQGRSDCRLVPQPRTALQGSLPQRPVLGQRGGEGNLVAGHDRIPVTEEGGVPAGYVRTRGTVDEYGILQRGVGKGLRPGIVSRAEALGKQLPCPLRGNSLRIQHVAAAVGYPRYAQPLPGPGRHHIPIAPDDVHKGLAHSAVAGDEQIDVLQRRPVEKLIVDVADGPVRFGGAHHH